MRDAIDKFHADRGRYPHDLQELVQAALPARDAARPGHRPRRHVGARAAGGRKATACGRRAQRRGRARRATGRPMRAGEALRRRRRLHLCVGDGASWPCCRSGWPPIGPLWADEARREREHELLRVGQLYAQAIARYYQRLARQRQALSAVARQPAARHALRRHLPAHAQAVRRSARPRRPWGIVRAPDGGVRGVYSQSTEAPLRREPLDLGADDRCRPRSAIPTGSSFRRYTDDMTAFASRQSAARLHAARTAGRDPDHRLAHRHRRAALSGAGRPSLKSPRRARSSTRWTRRCRRYRIDTGRYPTTRQGLKALVTQPADEPRWRGPYLQGDDAGRPWGSPYQYRAPGHRRARVRAAEPRQGPRAPAAAATTPTSALR